MYDPQPTVCINEVAQPDSLVLNELTIQGGRTSVDEQPRAAFSTVSLVAADGVPIEADLNQCARIDVLNSAGNTVTLFRGFITDAVNSMVASGAGGSVVQAQVTAVSALARLPRFLTDASYAKQFDGDLIAALLESSLLISWDDYDPLTTWDTINPATTWNTIDPNDFVADIEVPGDYEITAYSGGAVAVSDLAGQVAQSVHGVLYETPDGMVNYMSTNGRVRYLQTNGYVSLDAGVLQGSGLTVGKSLGDVFNTITVTYKNDQTVTSEDLTSQTTYGIQAAQLATLLEHEADAQQMADFYMATRAETRQSLESFTVALHNPDVPDATRDALLGVFCGLPIEILNLPSWMNGGTFTGFVEGYRWDVTENTMFLTCTVSEYAFSAIPEYWDQVDLALLWNTIDPALTWATAQIVS